MGCRILEGQEGGTDTTMAVFFCSTTGVAFGPVMNDIDEAEAFMAWLKADECRWASVLQRNGTCGAPSCDPRSYIVDKLTDLYAEFIKSYDPDEERSILDAPSDPTEDTPTPLVESVALADQHEAS
jgi:hypothetical protein